MMSTTYCMFCATPPSPPLSPFYFLENGAPKRSISLPSAVVFPAASRRRIQVSASLALTASSAALTRMPHFSYMATAAPGSRLAHFGMKTAARRALPACRTTLKNGCFRKILKVSSGFGGMGEKERWAFLFSFSIFIFFVFCFLSFLSAFNLVTKKSLSHTSHPIGLFLLLAISSTSFQSRLATSALSLFSHVSAS